jgi:hypothetical protein
VGGWSVHDDGDVGALVDDHEELRAGVRAIGMGVPVVAATSFPDVRGSLQRGETITYR